MKYYYITVLKLFVIRATLVCDSIAPSSPGFNLSVFRSSRTRNPHAVSCSELRTRFTFPAFVISLFAGGVPPPCFPDLLQIRELRAHSLGSVANNRLTGVIAPAPVPPRQSPPPPSA